MIRIVLENGKYAVTVQDDGTMKAERHGEPWRDLAGDNLIWALVHEIARLRGLVSTDMDNPNKYTIGEDESAKLWDERLRYTVCPICQETADKYVGFPNAIKLNYLDPNSDYIYPVMVVTCSTCGHVMLFSTVVIDTGVNDETLERVIKFEVTDKKKGE